MTQRGPQLGGPFTDCVYILLLIVPTYDQNRRKDINQR